jgi:parvulin-like peptidyl-prolyl isomerase
MKITVNREEIPNNVFEQEIQNQRRQNPRLSNDQLKELAKQSVVDWTIIRQHANKVISDVPSALVDNEYAKLVSQHGGEKKFLDNFGLEKKDIVRVKKDLQQNIKINQFLRDLAQDVKEPTEADIGHFYKKHEKDFTIPEQIHAAHIVMRPNPANPSVAYNEMKNIRQMLLDGADFAKIADEHSSCQDQGGDLGWFAPGHMVEAFDAVAFSMNVGEISPIFLTEFGYHIVTVYDKKPPKLKPLDEVKDDIIDRIKTNAGDDLIAAWVDEQKESAAIEIAEE